MKRSRLYFSSVMGRLLVMAILLSGITHCLKAQNFIQRQGKKLYYHGSEISLRGMAFGNLVWDDHQNPANHHSEADFERIQDLGMNAIRFYLNYKTFENDATPYVYKQSGWDWLDTNLEWARAHGIFLILNMHVPQGGFQSQCQSPGLWTDMENQRRLSALWKAIALRYRDEPQIAGFDIVNEPTPSGSVENWTNLAQRIIDSIRAVNTHHLIITERALALNCDYGYQDEHNNYPQVTENNMMYTVHLYDPYEYSHQNLAWAGTGDGGKYPDTNRLILPSDLGYATGDYDNSSIPSGTTDWTYYTGTAFSVQDDSILAGRVVFLSRQIGTGTVYFDDITLDELDASGNVIRQLFRVNLSSGTYGWWSANGSGNYFISSSGHQDQYSVAVSGTTDNATVSCLDFTFRAIKHNQYRISGWMKGENIPAGASASISTEYYYSPSREPLQTRNYEYLKRKITGYAAYIEDAGFPVYFGEFGAARSCFVDNKGGAQWVADAMRIFDSLGYHFTYHSYKESSFGYYDGWDQPVDPSTVNTELKTVFQDFFGTTTSVEKEIAEVVKRNVKIFPNPAQDILTIVAENNTTILEVELLDLMGTTLLRTDMLSFEVKNLVKGPYLLKISHTNGENRNDVMITHQPVIIIP